MPIKLNTASGGGVILTGANTASDKTITVPAVDATMLTDSSGVLNIGSGQVYKDASGNVGIGTSSPQGTSSNRTVLTVNGTSDVSLNVASGGTQRAYLYSDGTFARLSSFGALPLALGTNDTERARIDTSGNVLVNATAQIAQGKFGVAFVGSTNQAASFNETSGAASWTTVLFQRLGTTIGSISNATSSTAYNTSSDYRLKNTIAPMTGALAKVQALKPVTYKWNIDDEVGEGFIAHELAEVCPHAVTGTKDAVDADGNPVYQGIDTSFLVATLTAAIQEQQQMIEELKAKVAALEAK